MIFKPHAFVYKNQNMLSSMMVSKLQLKLIVTVATSQFELVAVFNEQKNLWRWTQAITLQQINFENLIGEFYNGWGYIGKFSHRLPSKIITTKECVDIFDNLYAVQGKFLFSITIEKESSIPPKVRSVESTKKKDTMEIQIKPNSKQENKEQFQKLQQSEQVNNKKQSNEVKIRPSKSNWFLGLFACLSKPKAKNTQKKQSRQIEFAVINETQIIELAKKTNINYAQPYRSRYYKYVQYLDPVVAQRRYT